MLWSSLPDILIAIGMMSSVSDQVTPTHNIPERLSLFFIAATSHWAATEDPRDPVDCGSHCFSSVCLLFPSLLSFRLRRYSPTSYLTSFSLIVFSQMVRGDYD